MNLLKKYQVDLARWAADLFGRETATTKRTRLLRFYEEVLELIQAGGMTDEDLIPVRQMVWSRPAGDFGQEIGGVMVTLLLAAEHHGYDTGRSLAREFERIHEPAVMDRCRRRQAEKKALGL